MYIYNLIFALLWHFSVNSSFLLAFIGKFQLYKRYISILITRMLFHAFFSVYVNVFLFLRPEKV